MTTIDQKQCAMAEQSHAESNQRQSRTVIIASFAVCFVFVAARSFLIAHAHSATFDTEYHVANGLALIHRTSMVGVQVDNPPTGSALATLPVYLLRLVGINFGLHGWLEVIAVWKSLLAMPIFIVGYFWARDLYGPGAGTLAVVLLLIEPTLTAHIAYPTNDTISLAGIAVMLMLCIRYVEAPSWRNWLFAVIATGVALLIKQNALFAGTAIASIALAEWVIAPRRMGRSSAGRHQIAIPFRQISAQLLLSIPLLFLIIWAGVLFRWDPFINRLPGRVQNLPLAWLLLKPWPAGLFLRSIVDMFGHARMGHPAYLLGRYRSIGWWYYFPVVATYKVPIAMGFLYLLAAVQWRKPAWKELPLLLCIAWFIFMCLMSTIDIGFRHALPLIFVMIIFTARAWTSWRTWRGWVVAVAVLVAFVDVARVFPDELSYINYARDKVWLKISDSNLDWGQGLTQARQWADAHAQPGKPISMLYSLWGRQSNTLDPNATVVTEAGPNIHIIAWTRESLPSSGILIASPLAITGQYLDAPLLPELHDVEPMAVIGHTLPVYDLDDLQLRGHTLWQRAAQPGAPPPPPRLPDTGPSKSLFE